MANRPSERSVQVTIALIGAIGVIAAALIGNWDKVFRGRGDPAAVASGPAPASGTATDVAAVNRMSAAQGNAYNAAADALEGVSRQIQAASVASIAGRWHDSDGYTYLVEQEGSNFHYGITQQGLPIGTGQGRIEGKILNYRYSGKTGAGSCQGELAPGENAITGRCTDADTGSSWSFQVNR